MNLISRFYYWVRNAIRQHRIKRFLMQCEDLLDRFNREIASLQHDLYLANESGKVTIRAIIKSYETRKELLAKFLFDFKSLHLLLEGRAEDD